MCFIDLSCSFHVLQQTLCGRALHPVQLVKRQCAVSGTAREVQPELRLWSYLGGGSKTGRAKIEGTVLPRHLPAWVSDSTANYVHLECLYVDITIYIRVQNFDIAGIYNLIVIEFLYHCAAQAVVGSLFTAHLAVEPGSTRQLLHCADLLDVSEIIHRLAQCAFTTAAISVLAPLFTVGCAMQ